MRILFLSPRHCWPALTGAKLREFYLLRALARRAGVTHLSFYEPGAAPLTATELPFCEEVISLPKPRGYTPGKIMQGLLGPWPLPVVNYTSAEMAARIHALLGKREFNIVHLDSIHMAAYLPGIRRRTKARVVYDWHNIESELMFRYGQSVKSAGRKLYARVTGARLARLERAILSDGSGHIVCSEREKLAVKATAPEATVAVIENGVDAASFRELEGESGGRDRILFVGSMNYHANVEGAEYFARTVWPVLRARFPQWRLTLAGSSPAPRVLALAGVPGVEVTGTVPDVRPYYAEAVASVVPLHTGGGTRLKILEAMAAGVPVISTSVGAEGLAFKPEQDFLLAETDGDWGAALTRLSAEPDLRARLTGNAAELVRTRYDWEILGESLYRTYAEWLAGAA